MTKAFEKAAGFFRELSRHKPLSYEDIIEKFQVDRRTAYRWISAVRDVFGDDLEESFLVSGKKVFRLNVGETWLQRLAQPNRHEVTALGIAIEAMEARSLPTEDLRDLRDRLKRLLEYRKSLAAIDTDVEAELNAFGFSFRPGPRVEVPKDTRATVQHAILALNKLRFSYQAPGKPRVSRTVIPLGVLYGSAPHLVGVPDGPEGPAPRAYQFRMDRMSDVEEVREEGYTGPDEDAFREYRENLFDSYSEKPVDVEWRFHPEAPEVERWRFHPSQERHPEPDGSVVVRFRAGGKEDMARHLVGWGDWVQSIRPKELRRAVFRLRISGLAPLIGEFGDEETARRIASLAEEHGANRVKPEPAEPEELAGEHDDG